MSTEKGQVGEERALRRRVEVGAVPPDPQNGDYWRDDEGVWCLYFDGYGVSRLSLHEVVEAQDGTITIVGPNAGSVLIGRPGKPTLHGFIENGAWTDA